jgi:hypothetical protein
MSVLIIGAGWYGCHLAHILQKKNIEFVIVDKTNKIFEGSSSKNQNRLHLGFHYPRSEETIIESLNGHDKFLELYSDLVHAFEKNLYFISSKNSKIDAETYVKTMKKYTNRFSEYSDILPIEIENVDNPVIQVEEKLINPFKAQKFFRDTLNPFFVKIENDDAFNSIDGIVQHFNKKFDLVINCTYNHLQPISYDHFELYVTLVYKINTPDTFAYTVMDGAFFSIYPYDTENKLYTVTSVVHGVAYTGKVPEYKFTNDELIIIKNKIDDQISEYIKDWNSIAVYDGYFTSWKTKPDTKKDDRSLRYEYTDHDQCKYLQFYGGKITGIFEAENILLSVLKDQ